MRENIPLQKQFDFLRTTSESLRGSDALTKLAERTTEGIKNIAEFFSDAFKKMDKTKLAFIMPALIGFASMLSPDKKEEKDENKSAQAQEPQPQTGQEEIPVKPERAEESLGELHKEPEKPWTLNHPKYGRVYVWHPEYRGKAPDEIVVCLHGHGSSAERFLSGNRLFDQFRKSGRKALYIVPESQKSAKDEMKWEDLNELTAFAKARSGVDAKDNITIMGHSGAYRTVASWLKYRDVREVVLLDASYGYSDEFRQWAGQSGHRLVVAISKDRGKTEDVAKSIIKNFPDAKIYQGVPGSSAETRDKRVIYIQTAYSHNGMVGRDSGVISGILALSEAKQAQASGKDEFLACRTKEDCLRILKDTDRYFYDARTGNYLNKRIFSKERLLDETIVTREYYKGSGQFTLKASVMEMLAEADKRMFAKTKKHIRLTSSYRNWSYQFNIYKSGKMADEDYKVGKPGNSFHGTGQAIDVANWKEAEPYLAAAGFQGGAGGYERDPVHFSVGEFRPIDRVMIAKYSKKGGRGAAA